MGDVKTICDCYSKIHLEVSLDCEWIFPGDHLKGMCLAVKNSWCLKEKKRGDLAQAAASIHLFLVKCHFV